MNTRKRIAIIVVIIILYQCGFAQTIQMVKKGGVYEVPCKINGLNLSFILDTGASDVVISLTEALFMLKNGYLKESDIVGSEKYQIANGQVEVGTKIILRNLQIGTLNIKNVEATIIRNINAPLLFGTSALTRLGKISIDYGAGTISVGKIKQSAKEAKQESDELKQIQESLSPFDSSIIYFQNGSYQKRLGNFEAALVEFKKAVSLRPDFITAYLERGLLKYELGDYQAAKAEFDEAIKMDPYNYPAFGMRANANARAKQFKEAISDLIKLFEVALNEGFNKSYGRFSESGESDIDSWIKDAIVFLNKSIEANPNISEFYFSRGFAKLVSDKENKDFYQNDINKAIELNPKNQVALYARAFFIFKDDSTKAMSDLSQALINEQSNFTNYMALGLYRLLIDDPVGAISVINKVINVNPDNSNSYIIRAAIKEELKDFKGAINDYGMAINLNPYKHGLLLKRAELKAKASDFLGAISDYDRAFEIDPSDIEIIEDRAHTKVRAQDFIGAIDDFSKIVEVDPSRKYIILERGKTKVLTNDFPEAINDFSKVIEIDTTTDNAFFERGKTKSIIRDYVGSISDFTKAINLNPDPDYFFNRGHAKEEMEDFRGAMFDYNAALNKVLGLGRPEHYYSRGVLNYKFGNYDRAIADLTIFIEKNPNNASAYFHRGMAAINYGKLNGLADYIDRGCFNLSKAGELGYEKAYEEIKNFCK